MSILDVIHQHRSIRHYTDDPVPEDDVRRAVEAGQAASTSSAVQAYCVIRVTDADTRQQLVELTGPQQKVADAGAFFVICGDERRHRLACADAGVEHVPCLESFLLAVIDATLFAQNMSLAFEALGYGICYIGGLRNSLNDVDALLELPHGVLPLYGLCVGRPDETPSPRPRLAHEAVLFHDRYPDDDALRAHLAEYDARYVKYLEERGATPRTWSQIMAKKFSAPQRTDIGPYYRGKGADLQ